MRTATGIIGGKGTEERWRFSGREQIILIKNRHIGETQEEEVGSDLKREAEERFSEGGREPEHTN